MKQVFDFLNECGVFYIATIDEDQPRVRPFGAINIFEDKLYIQTGKVKSFSKQIAKNPKVEISAMKGRDIWIRVQAILVEDNKVEARESMLDKYPQLKSIYSVNDSNTQVFYLKDVVATISSFTEPPIIIKF
ncbi:MAG: pyridoxamine 5'-phosphate oxidase family protein [Bacteroidales bacterium]|nr:pyridoxamine 5'-phosphate oxidase family protein [Bacteroidales bacterium]